METVVVLVIVALAALTLVRRAVRTLSGRGGCGCGRGKSCPAASSLADRITRAATKGRVGGGSSPPGGPRGNRG